MNESDDQFLALGDELFDDVWTLCKASQTSTVIDIGCGYGRFAHALIRSKRFRGNYCGFDILERHIEWCRHNLSPLAGTPLRFVRLNIRNDRYNPLGEIPAEQVDFGIVEATADVVLLSSVFTHMYEREIIHYLGQIYRMLRPKGRALISMFLLNESWRECEAAGKSAYPMPHVLNDHCRYMSEEDPLHAIGYDETWIRDIVIETGFELTSLRYGSWCGRTGGFRWQDYLVLERHS